MSHTLNRPKQPPRSRSAFTLVEMLLASIVTALTATAGATLIFAVSHAATATRDTRTTQNSGQYALCRIARAVRGARLVGNVKTNKVVLWADDKNNDDIVNLGECSEIVFGSFHKEIRYIEPADTLPADLANSEVAQETLETASQLIQAIPQEHRKVTVWAENVQECTFKDNLDNLAPRAVAIRLSMNKGAKVVVFQTAASPKASADYLFVTDANAEPLEGSTRIRRTKISTWTGLENDD